MCLMYSLIPASHFRLHCSCESEMKEVEKQRFTYKYNKNTFLYGQCSTNCLKMHCTAFKRTSRSCGTFSLLQKHPLCEQALSEKICKLELPDRNITVTRADKYGPVLSSNRLFGGKFKLPRRRLIKT